MSTAKLFHEPLVHFLLAGLLIYFFLSLREGREDIDDIVINRDALISYVQYRSKAFDDAYANRLLDQMSDTELQDLIQQYKREEALYREARKLGLEQGDYVIRQRLVGKMAYLTNGAERTSAPTPSQLQTFFDAHREDYAEPAAVTFAHVFLSQDKRTESQLQAETTKMLRQLLADSVDPAAAAGRGERFLFHTNYVDRGYAVIAAELGKDAADTIFSASSASGQWFGPVRSDHGAHVVFIMSKRPAGVPMLQEVREQVSIDYGRAQQRDVQAALEAAIIASYNVKISPDLVRPGDAAP